MVSAIERIEGTYQRLEKARKLVADGKVFPVIGKDDYYVVQSTEGNGFYQINGTCNCPDASARTDLHSGWCKHKLAVEIYKETSQGEGHVKESSGTVSQEQIDDDREALYGPDTSESRPRRNGTPAQTA